MTHLTWDIQVFSSLWDSCKHIGAFKIRPCLNPQTQLDYWELLFSILSEDSVLFIQLNTIT